MKTKTLLVVLLGMLMFTACVPEVKPAPAPVSPVSTEGGIPVFEINETTVDHEYCQLPEVLLSTTEAQGLNDDEIARRLMALWLDYFNTPQAPGYCRVDGYVIDRVYYDDRSAFLPLEPRSDLMRTIEFSIKLVQYPALWAAWAGEVDEQNWLHTGVTIAVFRSDEGYTMQLAHP
jgi:hypothetical protein